MSSESVYYGVTKSPLVVSKIRALIQSINGTLTDLIFSSKEYRLPSMTITSCLMFSIEFQLNGEARSLTILPHHDHSVSIFLGAAGCAAEVMAAIRPALLSVGIDWLALSYRADDAGDEFEMLVGSIDDLGDGDAEGSKCLVAGENDGI